MLEAQGYPSTKGALEKVARHLAMPPTTLQGWASGKNNPPPTELRCEKKEDIVGCLKAELGHVFSAMGQVRADANYRDLTVAAGILIDKLQILEGEPDKRIDVTSGGERISPERIAEAIAIVSRRCSCEGASCQ